MGFSVPSAASLRALRLKKELAEIRFIGGN